MSSAIASGLAALRVLRAGQWWYFLVLPAMALPARAVRTDDVASLSAAVLISAGCLGFAYGINAIAERGTDLSRAKNPLVGSSDAARPAWIAVLLAAIVAIVLSLALGALAALACVVSLVSGLLYSAGPRMKRLPALGFACNVAIFAPLALLLLDPGEMPAHFAFLFALFCVLLGQNQLVHERTDEAEDARAGALTTARFLGPARTRAATWLLGALGAALAYALAPATAALAIALGLLVIASSIAGVARAVPAHRAAHRVVSAAGGALLFGALFTGLVG